jgi:hypothetical protein
MRTGTISDLPPPPKLTAAFPQDLYGSEVTSYQTTSDP